MKTLLFFFLFLIAYTQCSECQEKTSLSDGEDESICNSLTTSNSDIYICLYDQETSGCAEKTCEEMPVHNCHNFPTTSDNKKCIQNSDGSCSLKSCSDLPVSECNYFYSLGGKLCLPKSDNSGCSLVACEDLHSNCGKFSAGYRDEKCVLKSDNSGCELIKCSDLTSNCESFVPESLYDKCAMNNAGDACEIQERQCEEFPSDKCYSFYGGDSSHSCLPNEDNTACVYKTCAELSNSECNKFKSNDGSQKCLPDGDGCSLKSCGSLSVSECSSLQFDDPEFKCEVIEGTCTLIKCSEMCEQFTPTDPLYKCYNEDGDCYTDLQDCQDLPNNLCEKWNAVLAEEDDDETEYQCVKGESKCKLVKKNSSNGLNISLSLLFLISLIL